MATDIQYQDPDSTMHILKDAFAESYRSGFVYGLYKSALALGVMYMRAGNYELADTLFRQTYSFCMQTGAAYPAIWFNNMGQLKVYQGAYEEAYRYFDQAMKAMARNKNSDLAQMSRIYGNTGSLLKILKEPEKAVYYCSRSLMSGIASGDSVVIAQAYNNLGSAYAQLGDYRKAKRCYNTAVALSSRINQNGSLRIAYLNLGELTWIEGFADQAIDYLNKAIAVPGKEDPYHAQAVPYLYLGYVYLSRRDYERTWQYATLAMQAAHAIQAAGIIPDAHYLLGSAGYGLGKYRKAYQELKAYADYLDDNQNFEKQKTIHQLETRYRTSEKEKELVHQQLIISQKEKDIQKRNFWMLGISGAGFFLLTGILLYFRNRQKLQAERWRSMEKDREISHFRALIQGEEKERKRIAHELHDGILSQLTAVRIRFGSLLDEEQIDRTGFQQGFKYLTETIQDLRKTAHNLMPDAVERKGLAGALEEFCRKLNQNTETRIRLIIQGSFPLDENLELSLYRIIQELVQNVLKHAGAQNLILQIHYLDSLLSITVEDDGCGFDPDNQTDGAGIAHVKERISTLGGSFSITSETGKGATVYFEIPIGKR